VFSDTPYSNITPIFAKHCLLVKVSTLFLVFNDIKLYFGFNDCIIINNFSSYLRSFGPSVLRSFGPSVLRSFGPSVLRSFGAVDTKLSSDPASYRR
jgi:hypothetical protein